MDLGQMPRRKLALPPRLNRPTAAGGQCYRSLHHLDVVLERASREEVPRSAARRELATGPCYNGLDSESMCHRLCPKCDLTAEATVTMDDPQRSPDALARHPFEEWLGVAAGRRQDRHDVARVRGFDVVTRPAMVPEQPARLGRKAACLPHELRRVGAK